VGTQAQRSAGPGVAGSSAFRSRRPYWRAAQKERVEQPAARVPPQPAGYTTEPTKWILSHAIINPRSRSERLVGGPRDGHQRREPTQRTPVLQKPVSTSDSRGSREGTVTASEANQLLSGDTHLASATRPQSGFA